MEKNTTMSDKISFEKLKEWSKLQDKKSFNLDYNNKDHNLFNRIPTLEIFSYRSLTC